MGCNIGITKGVSGIKLHCALEKTMGSAILVCMNNFKYYLHRGGPVCMRDYGV